jgi:hypothetical protein
MQIFYFSESVSHVYFEVRYKLKELPASLTVIVAMYKIKRIMKLLYILLMGGGFGETMILFIKNVSVILPCVPYLRFQLLQEHT